MTQPLVILGGGFAGFWAAIAIWGLVKTYRARRAGNGEKQA